METGRLQRLANIIGFAAYCLAVGHGLPDRALLAAALDGRSEGSDGEPAPTANAPPRRRDTRAPLAA
jgi:hypothetical protein